MILFEDTKLEFGIDLNLPHKKCIEVCCQCDYCGDKFNRRLDRILTGRKTIDKDCCLSPQCVSNKRKESMLEKHGYDHPMHSEQVVEQVKKTNQKKYNCDYTFQSDLIKSRIRETLNKRYGVDNPQQSLEIREKSKDTIQDRYGESHVMRVDEIKEKQKNTLYKNYGVTNPSKSQKIQDKKMETSLKNHGVPSPNQSEIIKEMKRQTFQSNFGLDTILLHPDIQKKSKEAKKIYRKKEQQLLSWLNDLDVGLFEPNYNDIIPNQEIDAFNKDNKLAIEFCGLYWHNERSPQPRDRRYHFNKFEQCRQKDIHLITLFEDEWNFKKHICQSVIKSILGIFKHRIGARKCTIESLSKDQCSKFLSDNHLLDVGQKQKIISLGLIYKNSILGVLTLNKHHRGKDTVVLDRLCIKRDYQIIGGASKLISHCKEACVKMGIKKLITWSDNRWFKGSIYPKLGFQFDADLPPDYTFYYINGKKRFSKQSQMKSKTQCPPDITEVNWAAQHGYYRIWDCGKKRWAMEI